MGCINRDKNSTLNMEKIVNCWLTNKTRPDSYKRKSTKKVKDKIKTRKKQLKINNNH